MLPAWSPTFLRFTVSVGDFAPRPPKRQDLVASLSHLDVGGTCAANAGLMNTPELQKLTDWLIDGARSASTPVALLRETCERLVAAGVPLWRVGAFVKTLHPDLFGRAFIWREGGEVVVNAADF